jgi:hypothetical protein
MMRAMRSELPPTRASHIKTLFGYGAMVVATGLLFFAVRRAGADLVAPAPAPSSHVFGHAGAGTHGDTLLHVLLALVAIIVASRLLGMAFKYVKQPPVIGEVIAGILLGPSLLGRISPTISDYLLPPMIAPYLGMLAQVGVVLFMFLVGLELDTSLLRKKTHTTIAISPVVTDILPAHATSTTPSPSGPNQRDPRTRTVEGIEVRGHSLVLGSEQTTQPRRPLHERDPTWGLRTRASLMRAGRKSGDPAPATAPLGSSSYLVEIHRLTARWDASSKFPPRGGPLLGRRESVAGGRRARARRSAARWT